MLATALAIYLLAVCTMPWSEPGSLLACCCTIVMIDAIRGGRARGVALAFLQWRPLVAVGVISYSLYLWHYPVLNAVRGAGAAGALGGALVVLVSLVLAYATRVMIEEPALRVRAVLPSVWTQRAGRTAFGATLAALGGALMFFYGIGLSASPY
ncbi:MAG: hypothetical protein ACJ8AI_34795 [Rhodopila sp.]